MGKRLRSLASILWDTEDEIPPCSVNSGHSELQLENDHLRDKVQQLEVEVAALKQRLLMQAPCSNPSNDSVEMDFGRWGLLYPWLHRLRNDIARLPRLCAEILPLLDGTKCCEGRIQFDLHANRHATASQVAKHVCASVARLSSRHPAVFKVGITVNPIHRWMHRLYGYCHDHREKWQGMRVVAVNASAFTGALLETILISTYKETPGCRNESPGGETASPADGPHFVYVVYRILTPPKP